MAKITIYDTVDVKTHKPKSNVNVMLPNKKFDINHFESLLIDIKDIQNILSVDGKELSNVIRKKEKTKMSKNSL